MRKGIFFTLLSFAILLPGTLDALSTSTPQTNETETGKPAQYEVILERETRDGEITQEKRQETIWAVEDFWSQYQGWELIDQNQKQIVLRKPYKKE